MYICIYSVTPNPGSNRQTIQPKTLYKQHSGISCYGLTRLLLLLLLLLYYYYYYYYYHYHYHYYDYYYYYSYHYY